MELIVAGSILSLEVSGKWTALVVDGGGILPDEQWSLKVILKDGVAAKANSDLVADDRIFVVCSKLKFDFGRKVMKIFATDFAKIEEE